MDSGEERQRELFEFDEKPRKAFPSLGNIFQKNDFENKYLVTVSPERFVFVAIGLVMVLVFVYALGVERGKTCGRAAKPAPAVVKTQPAAVAPKPVMNRAGSPAPTVPAAPAAALAAAAPVTPAAVLAAPPMAAASESGPAEAPVGAFHTIVVCTFSKQITAAAEARRLKTEGLEAYVYQSNSYFQVCVGKFADSALAKENLAKVRRYFKDAYIKYRQ